MQRLIPVNAWLIILPLVWLLTACSSDNGQKSRLSEKQVAVQLQRLLPNPVVDKAGWSGDIAKAFEQQKLDPSPENLCAVVAVIGQESSFDPDAPVPGLAKISWNEINRRAAKLYLPPFVVRSSLKLTSPDGKSYAERLDQVRNERELSAIFDDLINQVPLGQRLLGRYNPVRTGGPMQVSISFAEQHAKGYPYPIDGTLRREVFTRRGGIYFGTAHLLGYPASYPEMIYRFADYNAGWYASRNAAFQAAVARLTGRRLALDGDLIRYDSDAAGLTEQALLVLGPRLGLSASQIHQQLQAGARAEFADTLLWARVFQLDKQRRGRVAPQAILPGIALQSPKITRKLTTAWFAHRVNQRYLQCLQRQ